MVCALENKRPFQVEIREMNAEAHPPLIYERYESVLPVHQFVYDNSFKLACETCPNYQKNLSCPPHSPHFNEYLGLLNMARVICIRIPQEFFQEALAERRYRGSFKVARKLLVQELLEYRNKGFQVAGSGACRACPVCAIEEGEDECRNPDLRIYSLESLGTNLTALTRSCFNFDLEWSNDQQAASFVCAIGAVFY
jgi:predicted metal-binding protein